MDGHDPTTVYRFWEKDGTLLYIGITFSTHRRFSQHKSLKPWWDEVDHITLEHFLTRAEAQLAEEIAVRKEQPRYNCNYIMPKVPVPKPRRRRMSKQP